MPENLPRIGSALLVRDEANRILLGKRNKDPQRGSWIIPGGKIHAFESIAEAAARELQEETGLIVEVWEHFNVYEIVNPPNEHRIVIYSWGKIVGGEPRASDDISELKFFELDELGEVPVTPLVRRVLADAGFVLDRAQTPKQEIEQYKLALIPVLLAGASEHEHSAPRAQRQTSSLPSGQIGADVPRSAPRLPLEITAVTRTNLLPALDAIRGCLKTTSMLWMQALGIPVLPGVIVRDWSKASSVAVQRFCRKGQFSELLLRIDKKDERWARRRGGFLVALSSLPVMVKELQQEGRIAILLEPASPYADQYSLAGITVPEQQNMIVEVVGPGFDASDILRGDLSAHERWEIDLDLGTGSRPPVRAVSRNRIYLTTTEKYVESVQGRLAKIGARAKDPAFPDAVLKGNRSKAGLADDGISFLKATHQTALLKHAHAYVPIPQKHLASFARNVEKVLSGLSAYGIHLGPSSFAASVLPKRGLIFWDFFPARKHEAASLYLRN